jgi:hypothetical protein
MASLPSPGFSTSTGSPPFSLYSSPSEPILLFVKEKTLILKLESMTTTALPN